MSEYCGYVCEVKELRKHPNADRLQLATFFGNTTIVDMTVKEGDVGIYFPVGLALSEKFCRTNRLLREKDANGNKCGGYLDPQRRNIVAIKLLGEKSDGLWLPLKSLEPFGNIKSLRIGDRIQIFNGTPICDKYVPVSTARQPKKQGGKKEKTKKVTIAPLFAEHADTLQLDYNLDAFEPGDVVECTLKMHGCFVSGTRIRMGDGKSKQIQQLKVGDEVLGYNFSTNKFEKTKVINVFNNGLGSKWNKVKISRDHLLGDKRGYITATPNHLFWSKELNCWIEAKDLLPGMKISAAFPSYILTKQQKEILIGSFLGDGCLLQFGNKTAELQNSCVKAKEEYLDWFISIMNGLHYKCAQEFVSGYGSKMVRAKTYRSADMYNYFKNLITFNNQKGRKLLPPLIQEITPLSLAIFYMEDGSLTHNDFQKDRAAFAICDYTEKQDCEIICDCFRKFNIEPRLYTDSKGYNRIRLNTKEAYKFFDLIEQYIPPIMRYKLPKEYRDKQCLALEDTEKFERGFVFSEQEVLENISLEKSHKKYDLETELHNYVVDFSIVHNSSGRVAYVPIEKQKLTFKEKILKLFGIKLAPSWDYVCGTRRTVLEDFNGGYYGNNGFRKKSFDFFKGKLHKGEEVFFEIVGFTNNGTPIMPSASNQKLGKEFVKQYGKETVFSYGCDPKGELQNDFYVYRMTMTNEDGFVVEYSPDEVRRRCEEMDAKFVPVFWTEQIPSKFWLEANGFESAGAWVRHYAFEFCDGTDPIGRTHIREGVVARIVNRRTFTAFKLKNFSFKVLSGIAMAKAEMDGTMDKMSEDEKGEM